MLEAKKGVINSKKCTSYNINGAYYPNFNPLLHFKKFLKN